MKQYLVTAICSVILAGTVSAATVYDNSTSDLNTRFQLGTTEVGDEIFLDGGPGLPGPTYVLTSFTMQYYGTSLGPSAEMQVRFYNNDGAAYGSSLTPASPIWTSGWFGITDTDRATLIFDSDFGAGLVIPNHFTWSVQLRNIAEGGVGGLDLYGPPTVGNSYRDYWYNGVSGWELRTLEGINVDFAALIQVVPEPSTFTLLTAFGLALLAFRRNK